MDTPTLKIHPLCKRLPPLEPKEFEILEADCVAAGKIRDAIVVTTGDRIIDGRHRYKIAQKHGLLFDIEFKTFKTEAEIERWIITNQLGRRNLSRSVRDALIVELYEQEKQPRPGRPKKRPQNDGVSGRAAERVAACADVSPATVERLVAKNKQPAPPKPPAEKTLEERLAAVLKREEQQVARLSEIAVDFPEFANSKGYGLLVRWRKQIMNRLRNDSEKTP